MLVVWHALSLLLARRRSWRDARRDLVHYAISACEKGRQWEQKEPLPWRPRCSISYSSAISACSKGQQSEQAVSLLLDMRCSRLEANVISYSFAISACEKGQQLEQALNLLPDTRRSRR